MGKKYKGFKGSGMQPKHVTKKKERAEIEAIFSRFVIEKYGIKNGTKLLSLINNLRSGAGGMR